MSGSFSIPIANMTQAARATPLDVRLGTIQMSAPPKMAIATVVPRRATRRQ